MNVVVTDFQVVGELDSSQFDFTNQGNVSASVILLNAGANAINYHFQQLVSGIWQDLDQAGTPTNNVIPKVSGETSTVSLVLEVANKSVRLMANASGASVLQFTVVRQATRTSGGNLPLVSV